MTLQDLINDGRQAVDILTSPSKSAAIAGGAAGVFSAEASTLLKDIQGKLSAFNLKAGPLYTSGIGNNLQAIFGGKQTPVAVSGGTGGLSHVPLLYWVLGGLAVLFLIVRSR